jgi:uncharacterized protein (TIGR03067 family)
LSSGDKRDIQGTWLLVMAEEGGKAAPVKRGTMKFVFDGGSFRSVGPELTPARSGSFALDPARRAIDLVTTETREGRAVENATAGIYEVSGNRLVLCLASYPGSQRPQTLDSTPTNRQVLLILERE